MKLQKQEKQYKKCKKCGRAKTIDNFIKNEAFEDKYETWCNLCRRTIKTLKGLEDYLQRNNRFFDNTLWENSLRLAEKEVTKRISHNDNKTQKEIYEEIEAKAVGFYFRQFNLPQYTGSINEVEIRRNEEKEEKIGRELDPYVREFWGEKYSNSELLQLEKFRSDMERDYRIETASHKDYLKKICKISLAMDKALDDGQIGEFEKLSRQYDQLMKSAKFAAVQRSAADDTGGLSTFSDFVRFVEEEGFIPVFPKEDRDIVDKTISYLEDYLKRLFMNDPQIMADIENMQDTTEEEFEFEDGRIDDNIDLEEEVIIDE